MSIYNQLYVFVEGPDDKRLFEKVFQKSFEKEYNLVKPIAYSELQPKIIRNFINTFNHQKNTNFIFICDLDAKGDNRFCITKRKEKEKEKYDGLLTDKDILVVKEEIESWYLAGISIHNSEKYKITQTVDTEYITKEQLVGLMPKSFLTKTDFLVEILKDFDVEEGRKRNKSLNYFITKYIEKD